VNRTSLRRIAAPSAAALALGFALSACGASNETSNTSGGTSDLSGKLDGSGSSAQESAMDAWRAGFQKENSGATINYDPAGSGAGVEKFNAGGVDFAGSDSALDPEKGEVAAAKKRCGSDAIEVPNYVSPIAIVFNVAGVDKLQLSPQTIAGLFNGKIKTWDDAAIKADNPGAKLPSTKVDPVHRSDESGTTKNFTDYLEKASGGAWMFPSDKVWPIKSGEGANQTSGMISAVSGGKGTVGYADLSQVGELKAASIKVGDAWAEPSAAGASKAV
jgi:phosphate transport system substrate-binding protein